MKLEAHIARIASALLVAVALVSALPAALAQSTPSATVQQQQPGVAYQDGFEHGKADALNSLPSYGQSGDRWATDETRSAYSLGYGQGYAQGSSGYAESNSTAAMPDSFGEASSVATSSPQSSSGDAARFGYEDGRVAGSKDLDAGNAFRPAGSEMYRNADHGWTAKFGDKDRYRQIYRESYARGYQEGYGNSPTTY